MIELLRNTDIFSVYFGFEITSLLCWVIFNSPTTPSFLNFSFKEWLLVTVVFFEEKCVNRIFVLRVKKQNQESISGLITFYNFNVRIFNVRKHDMRVIILYCIISSKIYCI